MIKTLNISVWLQKANVGYSTLWHFWVAKGNRRAPKTTTAACFTASMKSRLKCTFFGFQISPPLPQPSVPTTTAVLRSVLVLASLNKCQTFPHTSPDDFSRVDHSYSRVKAMCSKCCRRRTSSCWYEDVRSPVASSWGDLPSFLANSTNSSHLPRTYAARCYGPHVLLRHKLVLFGLVENLYARGADGKYS